MTLGEMAERPIVQHWKCCVRATGPGVRIPLSPLFFLFVTSLGIEAVSGQGLTRQLGLVKHFVKDRTTMSPGLDLRFLWHGLPMPDMGTRVRRTVVTPETSRSNALALSHGRQLGRSAANTEQHTILQVCCVVVPLFVCQKHAVVSADTD